MLSNATNVKNGPRKILISNKIFNLGLIITLKYRDFFALLVLLCPFCLVPFELFWAKGDKKGHEIDPLFSCINHKLLKH